MDIVRIKFKIPQNPSTKVKHRLYAKELDLHINEGSTPTLECKFKRASESPLKVWVRVTLREK